MKLRRSRSVLPALALVLSGAIACRAAETLDQVLNHMDAAAKDFKSYSADLTRKDYDSLVDATDVYTGSIRLKHVKNGVVGIMDFTQGPDHFTIALEGNTVEKYLPKANQVQIYNVKEFAHTIDEVILIGFVVTRADMERDYSIKLAGAASIQGKATSHLILTPKSEETLKYIKTIELWIPEGSGNPIQQKASEPSGDYKLGTYSNLKVNPNLPDSAFQLVLPKGVSKVKAN